MLTKDNVRVLSHTVRRPVQHPVPEMAGGPEDCEYLVTNYVYSVDDMVKPLFIIEIIIPAKDVDHLTFKEVYDFGQDRLQALLDERNKADAARSGPESSREVWKP